MMIEQEKKALYTKGDIALEELGELIDELMANRDNDDARHKLQKLSLEKLKEFKKYSLEYIEAVENDRTKGSHLTHKKPRP